MNLLLIDDEYISNFINKKLIENIDASIQTVDFTDPVEAFNRLPSIKPDLILLDINMPVMNGWKFLDSMADRNMDYKVVVVTSSVNMMDRKMAANYKNVIGYIEKPATINSISLYLTECLAAVA